MGRRVKAIWVAACVTVAMGQGVALDRSAMRKETKPPTFERIDQPDFTFRGLLGERIAANERNWLLTAPASNPSMLQMFRDRDRTPPRDLLPWSGEFAGKYLTSAAE